MSVIRLLQVLLAAWAMSAAMAASTPAQKSSSFITTDKIGQFSLDHQ